VIFTDDLGKIPAERREQARTYEEDTSGPAAAVEAEKAKQPTQEAEGDSTKAIRKEGERLQSLRDTLDEEYNALAEENRKLRDEQKQAVTPDQIKAVNKKVVSFNARFKAYEEKTEAFKTQLEAYNRRVEAHETKNGQ
jgi:hypothetical protein